MTITLLENEDFIVLQADNRSQQLHIDRRTFTATSQEKTHSAIDSSVKKTYDCLVGSIQLLSGHYLLLLKSSRELDRPLYDDHKVRQCVEFELKPVFADQQLLTLQSAVQQSDERRYLDLLMDELLHKDPRSFYYSADSGKYDLSRSLQSNVSEKQQHQQEEEEEDIWSRVDEQFVWNHHLSRQFVDQGVGNWVTPIIRGFISLNRVNVHGNDPIDFHIVSRLGWRRVGTRYNIRGIDHNGNAANFVETEQIIAHGSDLMSFMQVRASIPLQWSQKPNLQYKPPTVLRENSQEAFRKHAQMILSRYGSVVGINLVNLHGSEKVLADEFERQVASLASQDFRLVSFDFHKETKGMRYENLSKLIAMVDEDMKRFGYFHCDVKAGKVVKKQSGVLRVNCIDCLDRTNVMESVFARIVLTRQLRSIGVLGGTEEASSQPNLEHLFKNVWADNGDTLSLIYSGTGALKADYTRTGKRTLIGNYYDGVNSITRYYLNNFRDGRRQDACNLFLGKYKTDTSAPSPFNREDNLRAVFTALKIGFFTGLMMIAANVAQLPVDPDFKYRALAVVLWAIITYCIHFVLIKNGRDIVNNPVLDQEEREIGISKKRD